MVSYLTPDGTVLVMRPQDCLLPLGFRVTFLAKDGSAQHWRIADGEGVIPLTGLDYHGPTDEAGILVRVHLRAEEYTDIVP